MSGLAPSGGLDRDGEKDVGGHGYRWIGKPISAVSFWSAIALPAIYLPLIIRGIDTTDTLLLFLGLVGLHVLMLIGGHPYRRPDEQ